MRAIFAGLSLLFPLGLVAPGPRQGAIQPFSVIVGYTPTSWSVECEKGCDWKASFTCATACDALVDSHGVVTLAEIRGPDPKFQFIVRRTDTGVSAQPKSPTAWKALSWGCGSLSCRARVTELGVQVLP